MKQSKPSELIDLYKKYLSLKHATIIKYNKKRK